MKRIFCFFLIFLLLHMCYSLAYADQNSNSSNSKKNTTYVITASALQIGVGTIMGFLGLFTGAMAGGLLSLPFIQSDDGWSYLSPILIGGSIGLDLSSAAGVYWTGENLGIKNTYLSALLGSTLGFGLGVALSSRTDEGGFLFALPAVFSALIYNLFSKNEAEISFDPLQRFSLQFRIPEIGENAESAVPVQRVVRFELVRFSF